MFLVFLIGVAVLAVLLGWSFIGGTGSGTVATSTATTTPVQPPATSTPASVSLIQLALLDTTGSTNGKSRGCDKVILVPFTVATTTAPLTSAMQKLFSLGTTSVSGHFNFIDRTDETLKFSRAEVTSGTARIYLTGSLSGLAGVCDDPRAQIQIEETALQFATVQRVEIYLNGTLTNLTPSQQ